MFDIRRQDLTAQTRTELPGSFVELSAGVTHYELRGDAAGRNVVLIHGNRAPYVTWDNTIEDLCDAGLQVLRYDLFGHGDLGHITKSPRPRILVPMPPTLVFAWLDALSCALGSHINALFVPASAPNLMRGSQDVT